MYKMLKKSFLLLIPYIWIDKKSKIATITTIFLVLLNTLGNVYAPKILGNIVENYKNIDLSKIFILTTMLTICWCAQYILVYLKSIIFYKVTNRAIRDIRLKAILHLHKISTSLSGKFNSSEVINSNERVPLAIVNFMNTIFITLIPPIINLVAISISLVFLMDLGLIFVIITALSYIPAYFVFKKYITSRYKVWQTGDKVRIAQMESLQNQVSSRINYDAENNRVSNAFFNEAEAWEQHNKYNFHIHTYQELLFLCAGGLITFYATYLLKNELISMGIFISLGGYMFSLYRSMNTITYNLKTLLSSVIDMEKILNILSLPVQESTNSEKTVLENIKLPDHTLELKNIYYRHNENADESLKNISLTINRSDKIAITGPSGSGKSTLCRILTGIYKPTSGEIKFFGQPSNKITPEILGSKVQIIGQDCSLREGTIEDNLYTYGENIPKSILEYFKDRLDKPVGDFGMKLSNGERQRILIARCIALKPEVVILDETFSGLDSKSSAELLENIFSTIPTVILVTHQQNMLKAFPKVYNLENGILSIIKNS